MRADLVPVTSAALERIKLLLLNMARQATLAVLDDILARIQQLAARPTQLDDFVNYMVSSVSLLILAPQVTASQFHFDGAGPCPVKTASRGGVARDGKGWQPDNARGTCVTRNMDASVGC